MDQESFRRLLQTPRPGSSTAGLSSSSRGSLLSAAVKTKTVDSSQPAFKPRKVKKLSESKYRDRAAERRVGEGNDYAEVEAVLEDFERRNTSNPDKSSVEEQRKYLGGDSEHTILVKGLDIALVEQNKAKRKISTEDDDSLEQAFLEASAEPSNVPKKRTREDALRELKERRARGDATDTKTTIGAEKDAHLLEEAKKKGKFKPIGFKPIGGSEGDKKKSKGDKKDGERRKKRRKVEVGNGSDGGNPMINGDTKTRIPVIPEEPSRPAESKPAEPMPVPLDDDFDIFAGAGEYEGFGSGDEDGEEPAKISKDNLEEEEELSPKLPKRWIPTEEDESTSREALKDMSLSESLLAPVKSHSSPPRTEEEIEEGEEEEEIEEGEEEEERPMRLVPLASSTVPSIKDLLAMDDAADSNKKKKKRKEKNKGGVGDGGDEESKKRTTEAKVERDYKRLKTHTEKKAAASGGK